MILKKIALATLLFSAFNCYSQNEYPVEQIPACS